MTGVPICSRTFFTKAFSGKAKIGPERFEELVKGTVRTTFACGNFTSVKSSSYGIVAIMEMIFFFSENLSFGNS
jgi:hypothetical protein